MASLVRVVYSERAESQLEEGPISDHLTDRGQEVARSARSRVRVRSGRLQGSIRVEGSEQVSDNHTVVDIPADATNAGFPYAIALEYGTRFMADDPFLIPALEEIDG